MTLLDALQALTIALVVAGRIGLALKRRWGWYPTFAAEIPWTIYALQIRSWGAIALAVLCGVTAVHGWLRWADKPKPAKNQPLSCPVSL